MSKYDRAIRKISEERSKYDICNGDYTEGIIAGLTKAEDILWALGTESRANGQKLWYSGSPNDLKPENKGTYILILKAHFNSDDEVVIRDGDIKIDSDWWDGENWENFEVGDDKWEVLAWTKLKWLLFPFPNYLHLRRSDALFIE